MLPMLPKSSARPPFPSKVKKRSTSHEKKWGGTSDYLHIENPKLVVTPRQILNVSLIASAESCFNFSRYVKTVYAFAFLTTEHQLEVLAIRSVFKPLVIN